MSTTPDGFQIMSYAAALLADAAGTLNERVLTEFGWFAPRSLAETPLFDTVVISKHAGKGIKVDHDDKTFPWRDLQGHIETRPAAGAGSTALPDYVAYRGTIYGWRFGTLAPNNHVHEAFIEFHVPHDYVPGSDMHIHAHWSQATVDSGGAEGVPGVAKWSFDISYAAGHGTAGGEASPFIDPITISATQQASTVQYGHMIAEVQMSSSGGSEGALIDSADLTPDGLILVRAYRDPDATGDTLNQDAFLHHCDIHYQSSNIGTKQKAPGFYS